MFGYTGNRALFTDLYQLTMSQGYFNLGMQDKTATFELFYRKNPFNSGHAVACGIPLAIEYLANLKFTDNDIDYLRQQKIFTEEFLDYLGRFRFTGTVEAVPEGSVVFPYIPLAVVYR